MISSGIILAYMNSGLYSPVMTNTAIEHGPFIVDLPIQNGEFRYVAMLVYQRVLYNQ